MKDYISAADANRSFSQLLRGVREEHASYVVTSHGKPIAKIIPFDSDTRLSAQARASLLTRLAAEPIVKAGRWKREDLYDREK